jgi:hypothetical protein
MPLMLKARRGPGYRLLIFGVKVRCALRMQNQDQSIAMSKSDRIQTRTRLLSSYVVAAISVGIAAVITLKLGSVIKHTATLFFCSVMLSSWYGGFGRESSRLYCPLSRWIITLYRRSMLWALAWKKHKAPG